MSSKLQMGGVLTIALLGLMFSFGPSWVSADEPKKEGASDVQERGVLPGAEGVIIQGNQLRAAPGYVLEKGGTNQVMVRKKAGTDHPDHSLTCGCQGGAGHCSVGWSGDHALCFSSENQPCQGKCEWRSGTPSKVGKPQMR
jgi:hypothetical protein